MKELLEEVAAFLEQCMLDDPRGEFGCALLGKVQKAIAELPQDIDEHIEAWHKFRADRLKSLLGPQ